MSRRNEYHVSQEDGPMYTVVRWDGDGVATDLNADGMTREVRCTIRVS